MEPSSSPPPSRYRSIVLVLLILLLILALWVRRDSTTYAHIDQARFAKAIDASQVKIAVVFAQGENELYYGMLLAFADPNVRIKQTGKQVSVQIVPESTGSELSSIGDQVALARSISQDPGYVAVVGHSTSSVALAASTSYEVKNLLYIATTATDPSLTRHGFNYVFRTIPTDEELSNAVARLCGWLQTKPADPNDAPSSVSRIGIFYEQDRHSSEVLKDLEQALTRHRIAIAFERPYDPLLDPALARDLANRNDAAHLQEEINSVADSKPQIVAIVGDDVAPARVLWNEYSTTALKDVPLVLMTGPLDSNAFIDNTGRQMSQGSSVPSILSFDGQPAPAQSASQEQIEPGALYVATDFTTGEATLGEDFLNAFPDTRNLKDATLQFKTLYEHQFSGPDIPRPYRTAEALAMRGYVAGRILRQAIEDSRSPAPVELQQTIRIGTFNVLGRTYQFTLGGDEKGFGTRAVPVLFKKFSPKVAP